MLIALALLVTGTLWINYLSLYYLVAWLPGIKAIRGVSRIILVMLVPMSVLVALGADAVWRRVESARIAALVLAGLAALIAIEPLTVDKDSTPIVSWQRRLEAVKALLPPSLPKDALLLVRSGATEIDKQIHVELDAMILGQDLGYPVLNGYSAFVPPGYRLGPCVSAKDRLAGYSRFTGLDVSGHARRLVQLDLDACPRQ
jgi:hypothetical protein